MGKDERRQPRKPPARADLAALAAATPGTQTLLHGPTLMVQDDNYAWLPDNSIDLILTDPPFNIAQDTNFHTYAGNTINSYRFDDGKGWDTYTPQTFVELLHSWAAEFARVLRPGGTFAVFCADAYTSHLIDALKAAGLKPRRTVTWRKPNAVPINRKTMMMSACEYIVVGVKGSKATFNSDLDLAQPSATGPVEQAVAADKAAAVVEKAVRAAIGQVEQAGGLRPDAVADAVRNAVAAAADEAAARVRAMYVPDDDGDSYLRGCIPNHISFNSKSGNRLHPTEKPVPLLAYLIALLSHPGDVVLDPFGGSGSTAQACRDSGRQSITVERDTEFFTKLSRRLSHGEPEAGSP